MNMTGPPKTEYLALKLDSLKATLLKLLQFHLPMTNLHSKNYTDSGLKIFKSPISFLSNQHAVVDNHPVVLEIKMI